MKTTIDIADALMAQSRKVAQREGVTLRALVEEGLRLALERRQKKTRFRLRDASVSGAGLQPGQSWDLPRELAYVDVPARSPSTPTSSSTPTARTRPSTRG